MLWFTDTLNDYNVIIYKHLKMVSPQTAIADAYVEI